jgi:hypothetical protein
LLPTLGSRRGYSPAIVRITLPPALIEENAERGLTFSERHGVFRSSEEKMRSLGARAGGGERIAFSGRRKSNVLRWKVFGKEREGFSNPCIALKGRRQIKGLWMKCAK